MSKCPHDPTQPPYCYLGMYHCPEPGCGEMVVGCMPHPDYDAIRDDPTFFDDCIQSDDRTERIYINGTESLDIPF